MSDAHIFAEGRGGRVAKIVSIFAHRDDEEDEIYRACALMR